MVFADDGDGDRQKPLVFGFAYLTFALFSLPRLSICFESRALDVYGHEHTSE